MSLKVKPVISISVSFTYFDLDDVFLNFNLRY